MINLARLSPKWAAIIVVMVGGFTVVLNNTTITVAIPVLMDYFDVTAHQAQWVMAAFMLGMGAVIPLTGYLTDVLGPRRTFVLAMLIFAAGSVMGAMAASLEMLILARVIQALGGGVIMPLGMAIVLLVMGSHERATAMGIIGMAVMMAPALGPAFSGYILETLSWRWVLLLNAPIAVTAAAVGWRLLRDTERKAGAIFDWAGTLSIAAATTALLFTLNSLGGAGPLNPLTLSALAALAAFAFSIFLWVEKRHPQPALDLRVYTDRTFSLSMVLICSISIGLFAAIYLLPILFQDGFGYGPLTAGMLMAPQAIAVAMANPIVGRVFDRFGPKPMLPMGFAVIAAMSWSLSRVDAGTPLWVLIAVLFTHGVGTSMAFMSAIQAGMNTVPRSLVSRTSAINHMTQQIASSLAVVILTAIFETRRLFHMHSAGTQSVPADAVVAGMSDSFFIVAVAMALIVPVATLLRDARRDHETPSNSSANASTTASTSGN